MRTPALIILAAALLGGCFYAEDALVTPAEIRAIMGEDPATWPNRAEEVADKLRLPRDTWYAFLEVLGHAEPDRWPDRQQRVSVTELATLPGHLLLDTLKQASISLYNPQSWWDPSLQPQPPVWNG